MDASTPRAGIPTHDWVYRILRRRIMGGGLAPGEAVTLRGLASELSVSMTPAREAVRRLVAERALEMTPTGRAAAPRMTRERFAELTEARELLEPALARRAAPHINRALVARLKELDLHLNAQVASGDAVAYVEGNTAFHSALYEHADAPALTALVESVWLQTGPFMRLVYGRLGTKRLTDHHVAAIKALEAKDDAELAKAIRADVRQGLELAQHAFDEA